MVSVWSNTCAEENDRKGAMSTGECWPPIGIRNGEFCVTVGPVTGLMAYWPSQLKPKGAGRCGAGHSTDVVVYSFIHSFIHLFLLTKSQTNEACTTTGAGQ